MTERVSDQPRSTIAELRAQVNPETAHYSRVDASLHASQCRSCHATPLYWITTGMGKKLLVDCDVPGGERPNSVKDGKGIAHFGTCVDAKMWSKRT
jgi:hypothetical protein